MGAGSSYDASGVSCDATEDSDRKRHGETVGAFEYQDLNKRYFLPCSQASNEKTIKVVPTPASRCKLMKAGRDGVSYNFGGG